MDGPDIDIFQFIRCGSRARCHHCMMRDVAQLEIKLSSCQHVCEMKMLRIWLFKATNDGVKSRQPLLSRQRRPAPHGRIMFTSI
jgi:hypothetical protein